MAVRATRGQAPGRTSVLRQDEETDNKELSTQEIEESWETVGLTQSGLGSG